MTSIGGIQGLELIPVNFKRKPELNMEPEEYIQSRVDNQIAWYSKNSRLNQNWFKTIKVIELVCAATIPFVAGMGSSISWSAWILGILGMVVSICVGVTTLFHHQENWLNYRTTAEMLKHEKYLYLTESWLYSNKDQFDNFVQRVESLISKENSTWAVANKQDKQKTDTKE